MTHPARLFDTIVIVDWSASARPTWGRDSIWTAALDVGTRAVETINHGTRTVAARYLEGALRARASSRVLVGVDFPLGYPAGFASLVGDDRTWRGVWRSLAAAIRDRADNSNNRFDVAARWNSLSSRDAGPFWGCPEAAETVWLRRTKAHTHPYPTRHGALAEYRATEDALRRGGRRPFSVWQTHYAGSVGSQTLTGIPVLARLAELEELTHRIVVWPFETGWTRDPTRGRRDAVVIAEVWPTSFDLELGSHPVRDAAQVVELGLALAARDAVGALGPLFAPDPPPADPAVLDEEGWILGA